jgi:NADH:ubiquinone oxidoreductase subunit F (NADH-binding)/NADH:ubiquinone oxidoreductase subunit E
MLAQALIEIQQRYGYLPQEELEFLALRTGVPLYRVQELTTFFPHFRRDHPPEVTLHVCQSMTCHLRGAPALLQSARQLAQQHPGKIEVCGVSCLGRCDRAPVAFLSRHAESGANFHDHLYTGLGQKHNLQELLTSAIAGRAKPPDRDDRGEHPPWKIDLYDARHGSVPEPYAAVKRFLSKQGWMPTDNVRKLFHEGKLKQKLSTVPYFLASEGIIDRIEDADLVGMGGAAARTGKKWRDVRDARGEKRYVICNADESEPGTFKDRELLLHAPHLIVEGMLLAGLVLGAKERPTRGYIYIRHEYTEQIGACKVAIERARRIVPEALELCPLEVFVSPGLYICGEESALIEAIEGKRAQPRNQPPDIRNNGLFDQPTLVNNVETFAWVPSILLREPHDWYKKEPLRFFSISGDVNNPGVFEVPFRTTMGQIIEMAGGMRDGLEFYAVAPSGPSGGHLPATLDGEWMRKTLDAGIPGLSRRSKLQGERVAEYRKKLTGDRVSILDLPLDVPLFRVLELSLGAAIIVYGARPGQKLPMLDHALNCLEFFKANSCGKCVPCRLGSQQLVHFAEQLKGGRSLPLVETAETIRQLAGVMEITSICGLGRAAPNPFMTWLDYFGSRTGSGPLTMLSRE